MSESVSPPLASHFMTVTIMGITASGKFTDGCLTSGTLNIGDITYYGTYDSDGLLHGPDCSTTRGTTTYTGFYKHGVLINGYTTVDRFITEEGEYTYVDEYKKPHLVNGTKNRNDRTEKGTFDYSGDLVEGSMTYNNVCYTGKFLYGRMYEGTIVYVSGEDILKIKYTVDNNEMGSCAVDYNGKLIDLLPKYILYICCNNPHPKLSYRFYKKYLRGLSTEDLLKIDFTLFKDLTPEESIGMYAVHNSLSKYQDYAPYEAPRRIGEPGASNDVSK